MPKTKLGSSYKRDAPKVFVGIIRKNLEIAGCETIKDLAPKAHMKQSTLYNRIKYPGNFRLDEIMQIIKALEFSEYDLQELINILGGKQN